MEVAWFPYWACSYYGAFVFKPPGADFDGIDARMFEIDSGNMWSDVEPGQESDLLYLDPGGDLHESYGTIEITDVEFSGHGNPLAVHGMITAGDAEWSLEGTFTATRCGDWGPNFPCE